MKRRYKKFVIYMLVYDFLAILVVSATTVVPVNINLDIFYYVLCFIGFIGTVAIYVLYPFIWRCHFCGSLLDISSIFSGKKCSHCGTDIFDD